MNDLFLATEVAEFERENPKRGREIFLYQVKKGLETDLLKYKKIKEVEP